jgi:hypothetical protein
MVPSETVGLRRKSGEIEEESSDHSKGPSKGRVVNRRYIIINEELRKWSARIVRLR